MKNKKRVLTAVLLIVVAMLVPCSALASSDHYEIASQSTADGIGLARNITRSIFGGWLTRLPGQNGPGRPIGLAGTITDRSLAFANNTAQLAIQNAAARNAANVASAVAHEPTHVISGIVCSVANCSFNVVSGVFITAHREAHVVAANRLCLIGNCAHNVVNGVLIVAHIPYHRVENGVCLVSNCLSNLRY
ncbi:MAG: hypothetical protein FWG30_09690 [Eubacteriaceae bacterium]|nr:hypothetical protein [Eubacteriaceae bacterium]